MNEFRDKINIFPDIEVVLKSLLSSGYGPYENLAKGYEMLAYYLENNNEHMAEAPSRQICHIGAGDTKNPDEYLTEIQIPIK